MSLLEAMKLGVGFNGHPVLDDVSFTLERGRTIAVIGPSGCGKSTLLSTAAGILKQHSGLMHLEKGCKTAFIMQDYGLFPWKTVEENLALPLQLAGVPHAERMNRAASMLGELGLEGTGKLYPLQLSGGQRQRVAIGRALMAGPDLLLMDEPFAALDAITRESLQEQTLELHRTHGTAIMLVTHSSEEAVFLGQDIMVLNGSPARVTGFWHNSCFGIRDAQGIEEQIRMIRTSLKKNSTHACGMIPHDATEPGAGTELSTATSLAKQEPPADCATARGSETHASPFPQAGPATGVHEQ